VLFASGLHLAAATPCVTTLEFSRGENPLLHELLEEPFELVDGFIVPSDRPGLGVRLRGDVVRSFTVAA
jgi:L-alanine-DL-glutamate epimerase-like enolase superfamily enzyme